MLQNQETGSKYWMLFGLIRLNLQEFRETLQGEATC